MLNAKGWMLVGALALAGPLASGAEQEARRLQWTTDSEQARELLKELRAEVEGFRAGPQSTELARKIVAADPGFALGAYYLSAVLPPAEAQPELDRAVELARHASDGERRFVELMAKLRGSQFQDGIDELQQLSDDYPGDAPIAAILGQVLVAAGRGEEALAAFERAHAADPESPRVRAFLANGKLLDGRYAEARATFQEILAGLPEGTAPFTLRYGIAFSHLYEGHPDPALASLEAYLDEYRESGGAQAFPEVFIWNSIARINLESGRFDAALAAYEKGYASVPGSSIPDDQKQTWLGRLRHGRCRTLARMGRHEEAWAEAEKVRGMIEAAGEAGQQYLPAYHYLAGYLLLEKGDFAAAAEHLEQADPQDPFHTLLKARAYERLGEMEQAKQAWKAVVDSSNNGLERALAYREAAEKLSTL
jgi:tetratricopeptide (TPR) repeat protein